MDAIQNLLMGFSVALTAQNLFLPLSGRCWGR